MEILREENPVAGALSRCRKNCNLWDCMNPAMILFKLCNNQVLGHRFRTLSISPKSGLELNDAELLFFAVLISMFSFVQKEQRKDVFLQEHGHRKST